MVAAWLTRAARCAPTCQALVDQWHDNLLLFVEVSSQDDELADVGSGAEDVTGDGSHRQAGAAARTPAAQMRR